MTDETASANEIAADASADNTAAGIDLADYRLATRTFDITARSLSVKRVWAIDDLDLNAAPELRTVIHGQAFVQYGDVRVIGEDKRFTEFNINLRSRETPRQSMYHVQRPSYALTNGKTQTVPSNASLIPASCSRLRSHWSAVSIS